METKTTVTLDKGLRFDPGDRVRVVTSDSPFFWWEGTVFAGFNGDFELGVRHYQVHLDGLAISNAPPVLFREIQLASA